MAGKRIIASVPLTILLIEDDPDYVRLAELELDEARRLGHTEFTVVTASTLAAGFERLSRHDVDLVLLDLSLPDTQGLATVVSLHAEAPDVPVIVVTGTADQELAARSLQAGAQDYLIKDEIDPRTLSRSIRYAVERHRLQRQLVNLSLTDELTGLYNRRGFFTLAERQLKLSRRHEQGFIVAIADLDGLKQINDRFGHPEGDRALIASAAILVSTFRDVDIVARLGGDEFAILVVDADDELEHLIRGRLDQQIEAWNAKSGAAYPVALSLGMARQSVRTLKTIDDLLVKADAALYKSKRTRALA
jgi:two-component system cell cycle response regulator